MSEESGTKRKWTMRRRLLVAFLALAGAVTVAIMPGLFWELHEANRALRGFSDALIARQYEQAYDFTSKEFRASADFHAFAAVHDGLTVRMGNLKSVDVSHSEVKDRGDGWYGTAEVSMNFSRGSLIVDFILKKENGSWKVYSYHEQ